MQTDEYARHLIPRLDAPGPHKILSIDGGGVRGVIAIEILEKIESRLRKLHHRPNLVLADYFDFIGGTSTGAIIAALLALGVDVDVAGIRQLYKKNSEGMFRRAVWPKRLFMNSYQHQQLQGLLQASFGTDTMLGSSKLKSLLLVVLHNTSTDSPWPLTNNPRAMFNDPALPDCNLALPLWAVVRASTAAPTLFQSEKIKLGGQEFVFVDGVLTPYNNPSFLMFLTATMPEYRIGWQAGEKDLLLVSVETGQYPNSSLRPGRTTRMHKLYWAKTIPFALIDAGVKEQDRLCRVFGKCLSGDAIDLEMGGLQHNTAPLAQKLFSYCRYGIELTRNNLDALHCGDLADLPLHDMAAVHLLPHMQRVGRAIAELQVKDAHFAGFQ
jgi:hypothetical protein